MTSQGAAVMTARLSVAMALVLLAGGAVAQEAPPIQALKLPGAPAKQVYSIGADGHATALAGTPALRLKTDVAVDGESTADLLRRNRLADTPQTRQMLKSLNPGVDFSRDRLTAGTQLKLFSVKSAAAADTSQLSFDSPNLAHLAILSQAKEAQDNEKRAKVLQASFYDRQLAQSHLKSVAQVKEASMKISLKAADMTPLDFAVAQYQIELANKQLAAVNDAVAHDGMVRRELVDSATQGAQASHTMSVRVESGQPPVDHRVLQVNVFKLGTQQHVRPLQVFVIPSGAFNRDVHWTDEELRGFLSNFEFANDASPVSQTIPVGLFDPRVCVGPKNSLDGMVKLLAAGKLTTCRKPDFLAAGTMVLNFDAPDDIARP